MLRASCRSPRAKIDGDQVCHGGQEFGIASDGRAQRACSFVVTLQVRIRDRQIVLRRRALGLGRVQYDDTIELGDRAFPVAARFGVQADLEALFDLTRAGEGAQLRNRSRARHGGHRRVGLRRSRGRHQLYEKGGEKQNPHRSRSGGVGGKLGISCVLGRCRMLWLTLPTDPPGRRDRAEQRRGRRGRERSVEHPSSDAAPAKAKCPQIKMPARRATASKRGIRVLDTALYHSRKSKESVNRTLDCAAGLLIVTLVAAPAWGQVPLIAGSVRDQRGAPSRERSSAAGPPTASRSGDDRRRGHLCDPRPGGQPGAR